MVGGSERAGKTQEKQKEKTGCELIGRNWGARGEGEGAAGD